jgi:hypothetical protein
MRFVRAVHRCRGANSRKRVLHKHIALRDSGVLGSWLLQPMAPDAQISPILDLSLAQEHGKWSALCTA